MNFRQRASLMMSGKDNHMFYVVIKGTDYDGSYQQLSTKPEQAVSDVIILASENTKTACDFSKKQDGRTGYAMVLCNDYSGDDNYYFSITDVK